MTKLAIAPAPAFAVVIAIAFVSTVMSSPSNPLAIATRLHLGHASHPPPHSQLFETLSTFSQLASSVGADHAVVAVDAEEKLEGYDLVGEVARICETLSGGAVGETSEIAPPAPLHMPVRVLPVTPWGKFVPALNALVGWSAKAGARYLLFVSAEVQLTEEILDVMKSKLDLERTLVVGTALQGHEYKAADGQEVEVELTGRTTPWNTCSLWNLPKLALTGFMLVSEGLHPEEDGGEGAAGVEEACTIATLQRILSPGNAQAKLISVPGMAWEQDFGDDAKRKEWHERKMLSKYTRAKRQLDLMGLSGTVLHC